MQSDHPESFLVGEEEGRGKKGAVWVWHVLQVRSETEVLSPVFFRIRFLDLVVRDVKIISKQHVGLLCGKGLERERKKKRKTKRFTRTRRRWDSDLLYLVESPRRLPLPSVSTQNRSSVRRERRWIVD